MSASDRSRREMLGWAGGVTGALSMAQAAGAVAPAAVAAPMLSCVACPRDHGATGDGQYRPLADRFQSLAAARAVYPFATSLRQSLDWAGLQAALDAVEPGSGRVVVPVGRFVITDSLRLPSQITLEGESRWGSIIDNQNLPLNAPQLVNKEPSAFLYVTIRNLTLTGGTHALKVKVQREVAGCVFDGVTTQFQSESNFEFNSIQTTVFRDCHLIHGKYGIRVTDFPCNSIHLINTRLGSHSDASLQVRGADLLTMIGGSMEGGGSVGPATIDLGPGGAYANAISFRQVYFENTHRTLLRTRGVQPVSFDGCKFTGTGAGRSGFGPYEFDCGDDVIEFGSNHWDQNTTGPRHMFATGRNDRLVPSGLLWLRRTGGGAELTTGHVPIAQAKRLLRIGRPTSGITGAAGWSAATVEMTAIGLNSQGSRVTRCATFDMVADHGAGDRDWLSITPRPGQAQNDISLVATAAKDGMVLGAEVRTGKDYRPEAVALHVVETGTPGTATSLQFSMP